MKLYTTLFSPFGRMARMMVIEAGLESQVEEIVTKTRMLDNPYHAINPSGRVPCLVREDGVGLEESEHICAYLDHVAGTAIWALPDGDEGWEVRRLTALARSLSDGVSVWLREKLRPEPDRSAMIMDYERHRARRLVAVWEREIESPLMQGPLNRAQITLACALGLETSLPEFIWRDENPRLAAWMDRMSRRPSIVATERPDDA